MNRMRLEQRVTELEKNETTGATRYVWQNEGETQVTELEVRATQHSGKKRK
jgi:hypothetical protein